MVKKQRFFYFIIIALVIVLGTLSRNIDDIPTFFGDTLYAVMIYFGMRFLFITGSCKKALLLALLFCFCIEFLQLYRAEWIVSLRNTTLGHYALGQGFLWSDLVCYTFGVAVALLIDTVLIKDKL